MAKFELPIFNVESGEIEKTYTRAFMPVDLYLRFQAFAEKTSKENFETDREFFAELKPLMLELFPQMTQAEYEKQTDIAMVLVLFANVIDKSTSIEDGDSKNG